MIARAAAPRHSSSLCSTIPILVSAIPYRISSTLPPGTYYFQILAQGVDHDGTGQYVLDHVTIAGSH
jgi:hypothetical protein